MHISLVPQNTQLFSSVNCPTSNVLFCYEFRNVVNLALLGLIFWVSIWVGTNFYAFYNSAIVTPSSPAYSEEPLPLIDLTTWNEADYDLRQIFDDSTDDENEAGTSVELPDRPEDPVDKERRVEESFSLLTSPPRGRAAKGGKRIVCGICSGCLKNDDCSFCRFCR